MEAIGVLLTTPVYSYLEEKLDSRFKLFRIWNFPQKDEFLKENSDFIRAIVGTPNFSVNREVIDSLPALEIISSFSVGLDHVDLAYCKEKGVRVTNTPDVLTEDVADTAIGLILATLRGICECDRYVRAGLWKKGDFKLTTKKNDFFKENSGSIRAVVGNANAGADRELIDSLPALEIVSNFSVGLDKVDLGHCKQKGIRVTNTPDVLTEDVADLAIGLMLATLRGICECDRYVRAGLWKKGDFKLTTKFSGKKVGIIGLGRIGTAIAKRAEAFNCPISYYSRSQKPESKYKYFPSVVELASDCDILVVACALTAETRHIINRQVIDALGPKGFLINIGRGPHIDEPELVSALVERRIAGAGLDVFEKEPHVPEELFGLDNVVLLPHVASGTVETRNAMADLVVGNLEAHFSKKPLLTPVV
ncbi:unnamed protein product [Lactuca virosa]|uniref:Hydroxyphenylpyruvate reductase n=1 Tax=Lactuca virosa TaxID=75947 RepID=A0AAU9MCG6_9ASTR|nr:unnamed protein product [Lactuca virosa]